MFDLSNFWNWNVSIRIKEDNLDNKFKKPTNKINKHQFYKLIQEEIGLWNNKSDFIYKICDREILENWQRDFRVVSMYALSPKPGSFEQSLMQQNPWHFESMRHQWGYLKSFLSKKQLFEFNRTTEIV